eukprot:6664859-Prymnesium_polylepis.1
MRQRGVGLCPTPARSKPSLPQSAFQACSSSPAAPAQFLRCLCVVLVGFAGSGTPGRGYKRHFQASQRAN